MQLILGGTSQSGITTANRRQQRLTTSFGVVVGKAGILIDSGTGIVNVAARFEQVGVEEVFGLFTHYHADHLSAVHNNPYMFDDPEGPRVRWIGGPTFERIGLKDVMSQMGQRWLWPAAMNGRLNLRDFGDKSFEVKLSDIIITAHPLPHPGGSMAYKIEETATGKSVVIATDCELATSESQDAFAEFVETTNVLVLDCQYFDQDYTPGYGHNCPEIVEAVLGRCWHTFDKVVLTHHDARYDKSDLNLIEDLVGINVTNQVITSGRDNQVINIK